MGPNELPCDIPQVTVCIEERLLPNEVYCFLLFSSFRMEKIEMVCYTCAKVTFVNFICNCLACLRDFLPGLTGRSILGVLMFALAVIKISLKLNILTKLTQCISQNSSFKTLPIQSLKCKIHFN